LRCSFPVAASVPRSPHPPPRASSASSTRADTPDPDLARYRATAPSSGSTGPLGLQPKRQGRFTVPPQVTPARVAVRRIASTPGRLAVVRRTLKEPLGAAVVDEPEANGVPSSDSRHAHT